MHSREKNILLKEINAANFEAVLALDPSENGGLYVPPNAYSLAEAYVHKEKALPFAICDGGTVVGFMMLDVNRPAKQVALWRLMLDKTQQGKGYGTAALKQAIEQMKADGGFSSMALSYVPGNEAAKHVYTKMGFIETGEAKNGEMVMIMHF